jgi:transcriptional regulator with XRE-family HTH domain
MLASPLPTARKLRLPAALTQPRRQPPPAKNEVFSRLGEEVRSLRIAGRASGGELARRCGISRSMLSRIERGLVSPSIATLHRLAEALDVPASRFFCPRNGRTDLSYVAAGNGIVVDRMGEVAGFRYELLGHLLSGNLFVEPYLVRLDIGVRPFADFLHPGLQFMYVLSGRFRYRHGTRVLETGRGDSLLFETHAPHGVESIIEEPVSYLIVSFTTRN